MKEVRRIGSPGDMVPLPEPLEPPASHPMFLNTETMELPPPSILKHTEDIVTLCEMAEVAIGGVTHENGDSIDDKPSLRFVLVTELACLLHLRRYPDARRLWYRYRDLIQSYQLVTKDPEYRQFSLLWDVAKSIIQSQMELVYAKLDALPEMKGNMTMEPLLTYAKELRHSYRYTIVRMLEERYDNIESDKCHRRLGFDTHNSDTMNDFLVTRGWNHNTTNSRREFWVPGREHLNERLGQGIGFDNCDYEDNIKSLTEIVNFLETKRLNA